jgi:hypothetical protein
MYGTLDQFKFTNYVLRKQNLAVLDCRSARSKFLAVRWHEGHDYEGNGFFCWPECQVV